MNDKDREAICKEITEMLASLRTAVALAGGDPNMCSVDSLESRTAWSLVCALCTNGVRFIYVKADE